MAHYTTPGVSIAVVDGGRVAWERGFGVCTSGQPDPVDADTLFQAGSVSKPVFALGAMRLVEQGRIALDAAIFELLAHSIERRVDPAHYASPAAQPYRRNVGSRISGLSRFGTVAHPNSGAEWLAASQHVPRDR